MTLALTRGVSMYIGYGRRFEDRCEALSRVLRQVRRGCARGVPVRHSCSALDPAQGHEEGSSLRRALITFLHPPSSFLPAWNPTHVPPFCLPSIRHLIHTIPRASSPIFFTSCTSQPPCLLHNLHAANPLPCFSLHTPRRVLVGCVLLKFLGMDDVDAETDVGSFVITISFPAFLFFSLRA